MYSKSKKSKSLVFLTSLAMTASITTWSGFAAGPSDGTSSVSSSDNQAMGTSAISEGNIINLDGPGDYRLVGADTAGDTTLSDNVRLVHTNDEIIVSGGGEYNIIIENVKIDINSEDSSPFKIESNASVNLTFVGDNDFKNNSIYSCGLDMGNGSLTITGLSAGGELTVYGEDGISGTNDITINGGKMNITGDNDGIDVGNLEIYDGDITVYGREAGTQVENDILIEGGKLTVHNDEDDCIYVEGNITISGGEINAITENDLRTHEDGSCIRGENITISGGKINASNCNDNACIYGKNIITISGGNVNALKGIYGKNVTIGGGNITTSHKRTRSPYKSDKDILGICSSTPINITGETIINGDTYLPEQPMTSSSSSTSYSFKRCRI